MNDNILNQKIFNYTLEILVDLLVRKVLTVENLRKEYNFSVDFLDYAEKFLIGTPEEIRKNWENYKKMSKAIE